MKRDVVAVGLILAALGIVASVLRFIDLIGSESLRTLAYVGLGGVLAVGLVLAIGWAASRILSATRPVQPEKQTVIRERIIDNRQHAPMIYQLPQQPNAGAFPELLRAAYQAGQLRLPSTTKPADMPDQDAQADDWPGNIQA